MAIDNDRCMIPEAVIASIREEDHNRVEQFEYWQKIINNTCEFPKNFVNVLENLTAKKGRIATLIQQSFCARRTRRQTFGLTARSSEPS